MEVDRPKKPTLGDVLRLIAEAKLLLDRAVPQFSREKLIAQTRLDEAAIWLKEIP